MSLPSPLHLPGYLSQHVQIIQANTLYANKGNATVGDYVMLTD